MKKLKHKKPDNIEYQGLRSELEPIFKSLIDRVNEVRVKLGKKPIKINKGYLSFYATENYISDFKNLAKGKKDSYSNNLVMDDWQAIKDRQNLDVKDSAAFAHVKREGLRDGIDLELDPLVIINRYAREASNHIHKSPLIAFTKEVIKVDLTDPVTKRKFNLSKDNPTAAIELGSWINKYAGRSNLNLNRSVERVGQKIMDNLTTAQLIGNLRTALVQSAALVPTAVKFGYTNTLAGSIDALFVDKINKSTVPYEKSNVLPTASWDVAASNMSNAIGKGKLGKGFHMTKEIAAYAMKGIDYLARKITFGTVYKTLDPLVKKGKLTEKEAIRIADAEVIRTQGSGSITEISPIQRNVLGKMATLWQTHTINQINFFLRDTLGIKGKKTSKKERFKRVFRAMVGIAMTTLLYEKIFGIQSPFPAVSSAIDMDEGAVQNMRKLLLELSEGFPFGGSVKFGSSILGPIADHAQDIVKAISGKGDYNQDLLTAAAEGNVKARIKILELIGKTAGIPGTAQWAKYVRGRLRGESIPRAAIGRIYEKNKKKKEPSTKNTIRKVTAPKVKTKNVLVKVRKTKG